jgi:hypothetical protein
MIRATIPHLTPMPAFAPVDKSELELEVAKVSDPAVLVGVLVELFDGSDEVERLDEIDDKEVDFLEDVAADEELEELTGAEVDIVVPDDPRVRTSVFNCTWNRPIPES